MSNNRERKPDIVEGTRTYYYTHTDSIVVRDKIWHRDFYTAAGRPYPLILFTVTQEDAEPTEAKSDERAVIQKDAEPPKTMQQKPDERNEIIRNHIRRFGE